MAAAPNIAQRRPRLLCRLTARVLGYACTGPVDFVLAQLFVLGATACEEQV